MILPSCTWKRSQSTKKVGKGNISYNKLVLQFLTLFQRLQISAFYMGFKTLQGKDVDLLISFSKKGSQLGQS